MTEIKRKKALGMPQRKKKLGKPLTITDEQLTKAAQVSQQDILAAIALWVGSVPLWAQDLVNARRKAGRVEDE